MKKMKIMLLMALMIWGAAEAKAYDHNSMKGAPRVELTAKNKQKKESKRGNKPDEGCRPECPDCKKDAPVHPGMRGQHPAHPGMKPGTPPPPPHGDFHRGEGPKRGCDKQIPHGDKGYCKKGQHGGKESCKGAPHDGKPCCDKEPGKEQKPPRK